MFSTFTIVNCTKKSMSSFYGFDDVLGSVGENSMLKYFRLNVSNGFAIVTSAFRKENFRGQSA